MVSLEYDHENKLIKSRYDFKWGWYSTIYTDSFAEINEIWYADSSKERNDFVLNREYAIKLNGGNKRNVELSISSIIFNIFLEIIFL